MRREPIYTNRRRKKQFRWIERSKKRLRCDIWRMVEKMKNFSWKMLSIAFVKIFQIYWTSRLKPTRFLIAFRMKWRGPSSYHTTRESRNGCLWSTFNSFEIAPDITPLKKNINANTIQTLATAVDATHSAAYSAPNTNPIRQRDL